MSKSVVDDHFSPDRFSIGKQKRTTRFYGVKFVESRLGNEPNYFSSLPQSGQASLTNPREYFREVYGPFLCSLLLTSAITVILGASLSLAGYYVPPLHIQRLMSNKHTETEAIIKARKYDETLRGLRIAGVTLLAIGGFSLSFLIIIPLVMLRRNEYQALTACNDKKAPVLTSPLSSYDFTSQRNAMNCSVVKQYVQAPSRKHSKRTHQHRASYDKGFLSPDLNRAPIFISDDNCRLTDERRTRSSSFDTR